MRIGIDISQMAYEGTGVGNWVRELVEHLLTTDSQNHYILFYSSMRRDIKNQIANIKKKYKNITIKQFKFPPTMLDLLWNRLHILPIETLIGNVDVFISSDWTEPPTKKAKKVTILYDLIIYKHPEETDQKIITTQKRKHLWMKKECDAILCISDSTKQDAMKLLGIAEDTLHVVYPGV